MEKYPKEDLKVYSVWFNMLAIDSKERCRPELIHDKRVKHFWDEKKVVGTWVGSNVSSCKHIADVAWDEYFLFDGDAEWGEELGPIEVCGSPVISNSKALAAKLEELLGG